MSVTATQTLPAEILRRTLLIPIAFSVAAGTFLLQGGTYPGPSRSSDSPRTDAELVEAGRAQLLANTNQAGAPVLENAA
ncbi:MAG: hypothetical protein WAX29_02720 [Propionibacterium sp.]